MADRPVLGSSEVDNIKLGSSTVDAMYLGANQIWPLGPSPALDIDNSAEFNDDGQSLTRTYTSATTWTLSVWVRRAELSQVMKILGDKVKFETTDKITAEGLLTTEIFIDTAEWYHIVVGTDLWINNISLGSITRSAVSSASIGLTLNGYLADYHFIDGQDKIPSDFAEVNSTSGQWTPIAYAGTFGTEGWHLDFKDVSDLGKDISGNTNHFTNTSSLVTRGTNTPTDNQCLPNPNDMPANMTITNAGKTIDVTTAASRHMICSMPLPTSGKYYWEILVTQTSTSGIVLQSGIVPIGNPANRTLASLSGSFKGIGLYCVANFRINEDGTQIFFNTGQKPIVGDVIQFAADCDNNKFWCGRNDSWFDSSGGFTGNPVTGANPVSTRAMGGTHVPSIGAHASSQTVRFDESEWTMTVPTGFVALSSNTIPVPVINLPEEHFKTILFDDGAGAKEVGFSPDLTWLKARGAASSHKLINSVVGAQKAIESDLASAEVTDAQGLISFDMSGFTVGTTSQFSSQVGSGMVAWNWKAGGSSVANNDGTIQTDISVSQANGCSIIEYIGNASAASTIGHGLGKVPTFFMVKTSSANAWRVWHHKLDVSIPQNKHIILDTAGGVIDSVTSWNDTAPDSSVISLGTSNETNKSGTSIRAFVFTDIEGFSSFQSYKGNGSTDGPVILPGFRPVWVMIKKLGTGNWVISDSSRSGHNPNNEYLYADLNSLEGTVNQINLFSDGFKIISSNADINTSGATYIYAAFAKSPFQNSRAA